MYLVLSGTTPFVPFTGVTLNITPLHVVVVIAVINPPGLTVTVSVNGVPTQLYWEVGVTV